MKVCSYCQECQGFLLKDCAKFVTMYCSWKTSFELHRQGIFLFMCTILLMEIDMSNLNYFRRNIKFVKPRENTEENVISKAPVKAY